ncbi:MAG TPA: TonB-dependent receptor [Bacteroidota bacterium]|nr:TonB-dependent receptor [Bacteroidota bacterium]
MRKIVLLSILFIFRAYASPDAGDGSDTARVYRMNEVTVTGSRMATDVKRLPSSVTIFNQQSIENANGTTVSDLLQSAPGVFLKAYGGSGSLQTISARGMGPEYTLVLVDGQRFTNYQNGQVDLGVFSSTDIERIEIARGGYSALFGADAVGGVINIITKKPSPGVHASVGIGAGSFGFQQYQLSLNGGTERLSLKGTYRNEHSSNMFDCYFHDGSRSELIHRTNADYAFSVADLAATLNSGETTHSTLSLRYTNAERGVPSSLTSITNTGGGTRLLDNDYLTQLSTAWKPTVSSELSIRANFHYWQQEYRDPMLIVQGNPAFYYYFNRSLMLTPQYNVTWSEGQSIAAGVELVRAWIVSSELRSRTRVQSSAFVSSQHRFEIDSGLPFELTVFPSLRYDSFSDVSGAVNPKLGVNLGVRGFDALRIRASLGRSFRVPTFNDLYWNTGGNPDLKPERSVSFDAGVLSTLTWWGVTDIEANYFLIDTDDRILWMPGANNMWTPKNISRVRSEGVELSVHWSLWDDAVTLGYAQNFMNVQRKSTGAIVDPNDGKQLPYLPEVSASFDAGVSVHGFSMNVRASVTGKRFSTEDNNPRYALDPFTTVDANIGYRMAISNIAAKMKFEALNVFNEDYEIIGLQPMPLRSIRLSCELFY